MLSRGTAFVAVLLLADDLLGDRDDGVDERTQQHPPEHDETGVADLAVFLVDVVVVLFDDVLERHGSVLP